MTERFTISSRFTDIARIDIEKALKLSALPEGVSVVHSSDDFGSAQKPFVLITYSADLDVVLNALRAGAHRCVLMDHDPEKLAAALNTGFN